MPVYNGSDLIGVLASDITFIDLKAQLMDIKKTSLTENSFLLVFSTDGVLFASSVENETVVELDNATQTLRVKYTSELTDTDSLASAKLINASCNGNLTALPQTSNTTNLDSLLYRYIVKTIGTAAGGTVALVIVAGTAQSDYTGAIDATRGNLQSDVVHTNSYMLIAAAAAAVLFMALTVPLTLSLVGRPMRQLAMHLDHMAKYDFSTLRGADRHPTSLIREVWMIQNAYWNM
ncbi:hypothetical protein HK405_000840, partial [Cladochytrium tenue]